MHYVLTAYTHVHAKKCYKFAYMYVFGIWIYTHENKSIELLCTSLERTLKSFLYHLKWCFSCRIARHIYLYFNLKNIVCNVGIET